MSITKFKFVSPGIFIDEIDKSQLPVAPEVIGPTIVGRSLRGPAMRPVKVPDYATFVDVFGEPHPGNDSNDAWRNGIKAAPTFGAYAAKAYLASAGPLTFVRLLGYQHDSYTVGQGEAGWTLDNTPNVTSITASGGTYGLFVAPIKSDGNDTIWHMTSSQEFASASLAAIFYVNKGAVLLKGAPLNGSAEITTGSAWLRSSVTTTDVAQASFKVVISSSLANQNNTIAFNFNPNSKDYIRNKFNTSPFSINADLEDEPKAYFLGETFATFLSDKLTTDATSGSYAATILALQSGSGATAINYASMKRGAATSETGWVVSQDFGDANVFSPDTTTGEYAGVHKLFKIVSLTEGEWNQNNIKIAITDIKPSTNPFQKYGSFTLIIRRMTDNDVNVAPLEVFTGLNLDPNSPDFIVKRIGDTYSTWDYSLKRFLEYGTYPNASKFVRVVVDERVAAAAVPQDCLPIGFYAPRVISNFRVTGSATAFSAISASAFATSLFYGSASPINNAVSGNSAFSASFAFPSIPLVESSVDDSPASSLEQLYWGIKTNRSNVKVFNQDVVDTIRVAPSGLPSSYYSTTTEGDLITLDDVMFVGNTGNTLFTSAVQTAKATWAIGNRKAGNSISSKTDFIDPSTSVTGYAGTAFQKIARFTLPLVGGFDGFDITEKEPLSQRSNGPITDATTEFTSYAHNSVNVALDAVSDAEVVETNLISVPGIWRKNLTNKVLSICESRADALGVIDLEGDYQSEYESNLSADARKPVVTTVVNKLKDRFINNSYGCAFFPAVLTRDNSAGALVSMPSSVVAIGTLASSAARSELWFAPAGFNRGGLSQGAAGFPVVSVKYKLTAKERDALYEANINPIASFPAEGIVVFGQKTLQVVPSALDRINVRRLMIYVKKEISRMAATVLFDPNTQVTWNRFLERAQPFLEDVKTRFGLSDYRLILDETTTTPELIDRNIVYAKIFLKPTRAIEFIALDFVITNTGASFDD
jgi:hypothetical protein